ncbi:MAG: LrgB family protein [Fusobacteriaceae bacterium]
MELIFNNKLFGLVFSIGMFQFGKYIQEKTKITLFNPILVAGVIIIATLKFFNIPLEYYSSGGSMIDFFLAPATVLLAIPLYRQFGLLKKYWLPVIVGGCVGAIVAIFSVYVGGKIIGIDQKLILSFIPKSITTPFGMELSQMIGGIPSITVFAIVVTGITGNVVAEGVYKFMGDLHPIAKGVGIGSSSHAGGTSKAIEMGEVEGAMSALSIVVAGIITIFITQLIIPYLK